MRLWSLHPRYLDRQGLVALWREALLAQKVLQGETQGYRNHPQLVRFRAHRNPQAAAASYLRGVLEEALRRGYSFDATKIASPGTMTLIPCTRGQLLFEWLHLKRKLRVRSRPKYDELRRITAPQPHPLFVLTAGTREPWEKNAMRGVGSGNRRKGIRKIP